MSRLLKLSKTYNSFVSTTEIIPCPTNSTAISSGINWLVPIYTSSVLTFLNPKDTKSVLGSKVELVEWRHKQKQ